MKYIVAVSGGVDSVVLLDMMSKLPDHKLVVAHFDHGIRPDSGADSAFVRNLANTYGYEFETRREELGAKASESLARERRYEFLRSLAEKHKAKIVTAHHLDDLVETVAINLTRGTGWRGLAVFHPSIARPLIDVPKQELIAYAERHNLQWHEDSTNASDAYLRNRLRSHSIELPADSKRQLRALHAHQQALRREINEETKKLVGEGPTYNRHQLISMPVKAALEVLRVITERKLTRPQLERLLHAVKTSAAGSKFEAGMGITIHFTTRNFTL